MDRRASNRSTRANFTPGSYWRDCSQGGDAQNGDVYRVIGWGTNGDGDDECRVVWVRCSEYEVVRVNGYVGRYTIDSMRGDTPLSQAEINDLVLEGNNLFWGSG